MHEVDEVSGLSKTPASALHFIERSSFEFKLPVFESSTGTIFEGKNTFQASTIESMEIHSKGSRAEIVIKGEYRDSPTIKAPFGKQQSHSKPLE